MKRHLLIFLFSLLVIIPVGVLAQDTKVSVLKQDQTFERVYFASGDTVSIEGTVNDDAYLAGGTVNVNGTVNGDLFAAGGTVNLNGTVAEDVRVAGGTVNISGTVRGNVTVAGGTVNIAKDSVIDGAVIAGAGTYNTNGQVKKDLYLGAGTANLDSVIGGDVHAGVGDLTIGNNSNIVGNLTYTSDKNAVIAQNSQVGGTVNFQKTEQQSRGMEGAAKRETAGGAFLFGKLFSLVVMFLLGWMFLHFFPVFSQHVVTSVKKEKGKNILTGFLLLITAPFMMIILTVTLIGIPLAAVLLFAYFLLFYISKLFVAMYLGEVVVGKFSKSTSKPMYLLTGLLAHLALTIIPVLGWFIGLVIMVWGAGAYFRSKTAIYKSLRTKKLI